MSTKRTWWSVASEIEDLKILAQKLEKEDGGQKARLLSGKMLSAIPRFEATEEACSDRFPPLSRTYDLQKRKRREYRQIRKQQFKRPEPNYSLYEGRTRGKRMKYTYSDEEDENYSDVTTSRRSTRNTGTHTPAEGLAPTVTLSGRQVKARQGGAYGESILSGTHTPAVALERYVGTSEEPEQAEGTTSRPRRAAAANAGANAWSSKGGAHIPGYNSVDEMNDSDEDDASEQDYGDDEEEEQLSLESDNGDDDLTEAEEDLLHDVDEKKSLLIKLPVKTPTPEKKIVIKLRVTPEKDVMKPVNFNGDVVGGNDNHTSTAPALNGIGPSTTLDPVVGHTGSKQAKISEASIIASESAAKSASNSVQGIPISPLALRGSPEKPPQTFPQSSVCVGQGGS
jgi:hypothetical protein